jgi:hypothetical protein
MAENRGIRDNQNPFDAVQNAENAMQSEASKIAGPVRIWALSGALGYSVVDFVADKFTGEDGFSLAELLVNITIGALIGALGRGIATTAGVLVADRSLNNVRTGVKS